MSIPGYTALRARMVREQIEARGVRDAAVLDAMRAVPRHEFISEDKRQYAYGDGPLPIGMGQTISQPYMVALMTEQLGLRPGDRVLEIGTGSGYQTAVLASMAAHVLSIERHEALADAARARLEGLGYANIAVHTGDGTLGRPEEAPYDAILVTAGAPAVPRTLREQLAAGGRLVCPAGDRKVQQLERYVRIPGGYEHSTGIKCVFVPLIGQEGWSGPDEA